MSSHAGVVALVGAPNTGKSSLFNALTGAKQKVGNYPGVTVEKKVGYLKTPSGKSILVVDLPGTYSLNPQSVDEQIVADVLKGKVSIPESPDVLVAVADATNLERTLGIALEMAQFGRPVILALNMFDLATKRGLKLDLNKLKAELGIPVVTAIAVKKTGVAPLIAEIEKPHTLKPLNIPKSIADRQQYVHDLLARVTIVPTKADKITHALDKVLLNPVLGPFILAAILLLIFQAVFSWAEAPMTLIEDGVAALAELSKPYFTNEYLQSFIADGLIAGVGAVIVFLPQILILFFFILLLEGSGYMARAAFILDRMMAAIGLQGRSFVPLLSSFACAIPGIMASRTIKNPRDRLLTIMVSPLMTCSARLPVYVLLIGAFIPNTTLFAGIKLQGVVMFALFLVAVISAVVVAAILKFTALPQGRSPFLMDLPTYRLPTGKYLVIQIYQRAKAFIRRAFTLILGISVVLWALSTFPKAPENATEPAIRYSYAGQFGDLLTPIVEPIGFDWRIASGLVPGFAAREVMVSALGTVFAVEDAEGAGLETLQQKLHETWTLPTGLALLAWYIYAPQCLATFAVVRRETGSRKWTSILFLYMLLLAYAAAWVTYHAANALLNT